MKSEQQDKEIKEKLRALNSGDTVLAPREIQKRNERIGVFGVHLTDNTWRCNWCAGILYKDKETVIAEQEAIGVRKLIPKYCPSCYTVLEMNPQEE